MDIAVIEERIRELKHAIRFYDDRGWDDLRDEYRVRLDELQKLTPQRLAAAIERVEMPEGEARAMAGDR